MENVRAGPAGETIDTPRHRALGSATRVAILGLVRAAETGRTADDVAAHTGLHPSTVRAHLDLLTEAGLLVRARASGGLPGRPAWRYRAAAPDPAPAPYRALAAALLDEIAAGTSQAGEAGEARGAGEAGEARGAGDAGGAGTTAPSTAEPGTAAVRAGQRWGRRLAPADAAERDPVDVVTDVLDELGFDPRVVPVDNGGTEVHLHTCPFLELVARQPDAMCGLHLGVIRGVLERAGTRDGGAVLEPFGAPTACVVRLPYAGGPAPAPAPAPAPRGRPVADRPVADRP